MRKILMAIAATMMIAGGSQAMAQNRGHHAPQTQHKPSQNYKPVHNYKPVQYNQRNVPPAPRSWGKRSKQQWLRHVNACSKRYNSYNPRTDRYTVRGRQTAVCRL